MRKLIIEAKSKPCVDCKKSYPYYVMDFDHVRGTKEFGLAIAANACFKVERILREIEKCDVVCSNCHRERSARRDPNIFDPLGFGVISNASDSESEVDGA